MGGLMNTAMPGGQLKDYPKFDYARDHPLGAEQTAPLNNYHQAALDTIGHAPGYQANYGNAQDLAGNGDYYHSNLPVEQTHVGAFSPESVASFANPHDQMVIDQGMGDLTKAYGKAQVGADDAASNAGAFGGSRHALLGGEIARNTGDSMARFVSGAREAGYDKAVAARQGEINNNLNIDNHGLAVNQANNAEQQREFGNQVNLAGQGDVLASQLASLQQGAGNLVRGVDQETRDKSVAELHRQADYPINLAQQLAAINTGSASTYPVSSTGSTTQTGGPGKGSSMLGTGISALGSTSGSWMPALAAALPFSDERMKDDVRDDVDPEATLGAFSELPVTSWKYSDAAQAEHGVDDNRHVGGMAQDVERLMGPDVAPTDADGNKRIDVVSMLGKISAAIKALSERTQHLATDDAEAA